MEKKLLFLRLVVTMRSCGGMEVGLGGRRWVHGLRVRPWRLWRRWFAFGSGVLVVVLPSLLLGPNRRRAGCSHDGGGDDLGLVLERA